MPATAGFVAADWSITRGAGAGGTTLIDYIGDTHIQPDPSYARVIEFHRAIADFADDATSLGDDEHDITDPDATDRSTDNIITILAGYTITDRAIEHLYDGSIIQVEDDSIWDGVVNFGTAVQIQVTQNRAILNSQAHGTGAIPFWNNDPFVTGFGLNADAAAGISHRFLVKVRDAGADIDGRRLLGTSRRFGFQYSEFSINGSSRGNNVLALSEGNDLNNESAEVDVATWVAFITNTFEGYNPIDVNNNGSPEFYYSKWDAVAGGTNRSGTINDIYELTKYLTRDGSTSTLYGLNGELFRGVTHEVDLNAGGVNSGIFNAFEEVRWGSGPTAGVGQMLAINDTTASGATKFWMQLLSGVVPGDGVLVTGQTSLATATTAASNAVTDRRPVPLPFLGQSTGSAIIGGFGVGFDTSELSSGDQVFDLTGSPIAPPNNITVSVSDLEFATPGEEDYVLVTNNAGGDIDYTQLALASPLTTAGVTSVPVTTTIPSDTPSSGTIRVQDDSGRYRRLVYSSYSGSTFTIDSAASGTENDFNVVQAAAANNVFISYLDQVADAAALSFIGVNINRTFFIRVRNGGSIKTTEPVRPIKPFSATLPVNLASAGVSVGRILDA